MVFLKFLVGGSIIELSLLFAAIKQCSNRTKKEGFKAQIYAAFERK